MNTKIVRTRFAPSPTGYLHVGGLRTALYNYLFAKQQKGQFILRLEDTDRERLVEGAGERIMQILKQFDLQYDEGPDIGGDFGPYIQSQRLDLYHKYADELIKTGNAYYCFCSPERLKELREKQIKAKQPPKYDRHCCNLSKEEIQLKIEKGESYVVRLKIPEGETSFADLIRGTITVKNETLDDQILIKSDGFPTYHLAVVVDDHLMNITHVIRGEEWIPSTPKHVIIYQALGWPLPQYAHLPLLLNPDRSKLSKRQGDVAVEDYLKQGFLPEALLNFIALLGWNPGTDEEIFSLSELLKIFDLTRVQKSGAVFNREKLNWLNAYYIRKTDPAKLADLVKPYLQETDYFVEDKFDLKKVIKLFQERMEKLSDIKEKASFLFVLPNYDGEILIPKKSDKNKTAVALELCQKLLQEYTQEWQENALREFLDKEREKQGFSRAEIFWPLRVAVSGATASPDVFAILDILGREESLRRIKIALEKLQK